MHEKGKECCVYVQTVFNRNEEESLEAPDEYEELWRAFCSCITIKERTDLKLQKQFVPLKFRSNMLEFYE